VDLQKGSSAPRAWEAENATQVARITIRNGLDTRMAVPISPTSQWGLLSHNLIKIIKLKGQIIQGLVSAAIAIPAATETFSEATIDPRG